jgi:putative aldouronate transport system permease protein
MSNALADVALTRRTKFEAYRRRLHRGRYLLLMISLPVVYYAVFKYLPIYGVIIAFEDFEVYRGIMGSPWVGFKWFSKFLSDEFFWRAVKNTAVLSALSLVFGMPAPIILALLINEVGHVRYKRLVQSFTYLPHFISTAVVVGMIVNFFSLDGIVNKAIMALGGEGIQFMQEPGWFRPLYIGSGIWQYMGWGSIIYLAAISAINPELYEAAIVDGANRFRRIGHITIPCIVPTISIIFIIQVGRILRVGFEKVLLMQAPLIYETADVIQTYVYRRGIVGLEYSYGTAVNLFQSVIGAGLLIGANRLAKRLSGTGFW